MANYIGKIAAVGTINMSQIASGLNASARDVDKYARTVRSTIVSANSAAGRSFQDILTPLQRLERALQAANTQTLDIKVGGSAERIRAIVGAANDIAKPLGESRKQFTALSATVQNEFIGSLVRAQNAAQLAENAINRGQIKNAAGYERLKRVVDDVIASQERLSEAQSLTSPLATGRELRFNRPDLATELQRSAASQAALTPQVIASAGRPADVEAARNIVALQKRQADEALRLLAVLENVRNTRGGDAAAIQKANADLTRQLKILQETNKAAEGFVSTSSIRGLARRASDAADRRASGSFGSLDAAERGAEQLFARITQLGPQAFRQLSEEIDRFASSFSTGFVGPVNQEFQRLLTGVKQLEAAAGLLERPGLGLFGSQTGTDADQAIARAKRVSEEFQRLPDAAKAGLAGLAEIASRVANGVADGTSNANQLNAALDQLQPKIEEANAAVADQRRRVEVASTFLPPVIDLPPSESQRRAEQSRSARREIGLDRTPSEGLDRLGASIARTREAIGSLPQPLQERFLPLLARADDLFVKMRLSGTATATQVEAGARAMAVLARETDRAQKASTLFGGSFAEFSQDRSATVAAARFQVLRGELLGAGVTAGAAVEAVDALQAALVRAASTKGGFKEQAADIRSLEVAAINQVAAASKQSPAGLARSLNRAGDISSKRFQNLGLAAQQAAFAFEDFFSVTGGLDQRIRAAGNNISQLGFVLGGTTGLVAGISVAIGSQLFVALYKFINAGRETRDEVKALNDLFSREKTIVDELAGSFERLADAVAGRSLSGPAKEARDFANQLDSIRKRQRELRDNQAFSLDEGVLRARADVNVAQRGVEQARTRDQGVAAQRRLAEARQRLREREQAIAGRQGVTVEQAQATLDILFENQFLSLARDANATQFGAGDFVRQQQIRANQAAIREQLGGLVAPDQAAERLRTFQKEAQRQGDTRLVAVIEQLISQLRETSVRQSDERGVRLAETTNALSRSIEGVRGRVEQLDQSGLRQASDALGRRLDALSSEVTRASDALTDAFAIEDADKRRQAIAAAEDELNARKQALEQELRSISITTLALDLFSDSLERAASVVQSDLESSRRDAEQARRQDLQFSTPETRRRREAELDRFGQQRDAARAAQRDIEIERARLQTRLAQAGVGLGVQDPLGRLDQITNQLAGGGLTEDQRVGLVREQERIQAAIDPIIEAFDIAAQAITQGAEQIRERNVLAAEGDQLLRSEAEREAGKLAREFEAIRLSFEQERTRVQAAGGAVDPSRLQAAQAQVLASGVERLAPLLAQFAAEVKNAALAGPSRSAIQASDVTTAEGNRERIRIVQQDDPNRNVNLVELRRQTAALEELLNLARQQGVVIAQ